MRTYKVVDAFSAKPFLGNPVAVVLDADGLTTDEMQMIASWTNLSETTFVLPPQNPDADYRLRIFDPRNEMPFAGHPTLGSAHALIEAKRVMPKNGMLVQECGVGLVKIDINDAGAERIITLSLPPASLRTLSEPEITELEGILGVRVRRDNAPAVIDVGAVWIVAQMENASTVLQIKPDAPRSAALERKLGLDGVTVFGRYRDGSNDIEVRSFAPSCGIEEDPVCGSGNGCVAIFQTRHGMIPPTATAYLARQGQCVGRDGRVFVSIDDDGQVKIGGACVTCLDGTLAAIA